MYPSDKYCQFKWSSIYKELKTEVNDFLNLFKSSFPGSSVGIHPCPIRSHRRPGFDPWVRKIPEGRKWHPLHCSCLENPMDGDAWWPTAHGVSQSWTGLKWLRMHTQEHFREGNGNPLQFLPGHFHGQRSLAGYGLWGRRVGHDWVTNTQS